MELGIRSSYEFTYNPKRLYAISREKNRAELRLKAELSFFGYDVWNHYEVSWLDRTGKPQVALGCIVYSCDSVNIVESKSLKLYFNTLNNTKFDSLGALVETITHDLSVCVGAPVSVSISPIENNAIILSPVDGVCIDDCDVNVKDFELNSDHLMVEGPIVREVLYSHLLKSNCLVTGQPDWASVWVEYNGTKISRSGLLEYIISFRNHNEFHEHCVERIFVDILEKCKPKDLTVGARYTRRGGIDINPVRSTDEGISIFNSRLIRQ